MLERAGAWRWGPGGAWIKTCFFFLFCLLYLYEYELYGKGERVGGSKTISEGEMRGGGGCLLFTKDYLWTLYG